MAEPRLHTHITDGLPTTHPLAFQQVRCSKCGALVHAGNMRTWIECEDDVVCGPCVGLPEVITSSTVDGMIGRRG